MNEQKIAPVLSDEDALQIFADNGECSESADNAGYMPIRDRGALRIARAIEQAVLARVGAVRFGTPAAAWRVAGEQDPHAGHYDGERANLALGNLTDDELANGAFMNYDRPMDIEAILRHDKDYHPPIAWMTAVKDRIRWLSRKLESTSEELSALKGTPAAAVADDEPFGHVFRVDDESVRIELVGQPHIKDGMPVFLAPQSSGNPGPLAAVELPPLPSHRFCLNSSPVVEGYTADQMREYARAAIAASKEGASQ